MRKSTLTTVLLAVLAGLVIASVAMATPATADDFDLVAEIEPLTPADPPVIVAVPLLPPPVIDDFAAPPSLQFDLRVDCEGETPPVTLWMRNTGADDVTLEITNLVGDAGFVLEAGTEEVHEVWYHPIEMDETAVTVSIKDGDQVFADQESIVCLRPDVSYAFVVDCDSPGAAVQLTNHGVLEQVAGVTVDEGAPNAVAVQPGETVQVALPHAPDEVLDVEVFAAGEYPFAGPWSYSCPVPEVAQPSPEQAGHEATDAAQPTAEPVEPAEAADVIEAPDQADDDIEGP